MSRDNPQFVRAGRARAAFLILFAFQFVGIVRVQQVSTDRVHDLRTLVDQNTVLTHRVAADETQLRTVGNGAVVAACVDLNALKGRVATALEQTSRRTLSVQKAVLQSVTATDIQRAQALRLIASANATLDIVDSIFATQKCKGPF